MITTLKQARSALNHLNPGDIRKSANRPIRVGLIASTAAGYAAMEDTLSPHAASSADRLHGMDAMFRGGDPDAPGNVDLVLYEQGIPIPKGAYVLFRDDPAMTLGDVLQDDDSLGLPLARNFAGLRKFVVDRIIQSVARENALFAIATALPDVIPNLIELPWVFGEWASDTAFLTANEIRMAFMISAAAGHEVGFSHQKAQILSIGAGAFGFRAIARELAGKIPLGGGLIAKGAIAYAGTYVVGRGLAMATGGDTSYTADEKRDIYRDALERGKDLAKSLTSGRFKTSHGD